MVGALVHQPCCGELLDDLAKEIRRGGEIEKKVPVRSMVLVQLFERRLQLGIKILVVKLCGDVIHPPREPFPNIRIDFRACKMTNVFGKLVPEFIGGHLAVRHSENRKFARQKLHLGQVIKRRNELAAGQVSGSAEDDHNARVGGATGRAHLGSGKHFRLALVGAIVDE